MSDHDELRRRISGTYAMLGLFDNPRTQVAPTPTDDADHLVTSDGDFIVTSDGDSIVLSDT